MRMDYNLGMNKITGHLNTINTHKLLVMKLCFRCGLYKQGLLHDLSKYSPVELKDGFKYYNGKCSPNAVAIKKNGYSSAWLHHKGRNPHHWQFWLDNGKNGIKAQRMPEKYVVEMFCDRVAANMVYNKENYRDDMALGYYLRTHHRMMLHPETDDLLLKLLLYLADNGLDNTIKHIRKDILKNEK